MKKSHYIYKSTKLIHILLEYTEDHIIDSITITGDFFVYPEERLNQLEGSLIGIRLEEYTIKQKIQEWLGNSEVFGFDAESLTKAIMGCLKNSETKI